MAEIFFEVKNIEKEIIEHRRNLHRLAEVGFDLPKTTDYISKSLEEIGCEVRWCGNNGIYTVLGDKNSGECRLFRADMDALPVKEEADVDFRSEENMHACGHDLHSAILLGVAKILKIHENELSCAVKLLFQPAEEILSGAKNMIDNGILDNVIVTSAFMIHTIVNTPLKSGTVVVTDGGISAPATDYFEVEVNGKGCHGAMPNTGVDPIIVACEITRALDTIKTRELSLYDSSVITVGMLNAGSAPNVIPDKALIKGSFRSFDVNIQNKIKDSLVRICDYTAKAHKASVNIQFPMGCPCLENDNELSESVFNLLRKEIDNELVLSQKVIREKSNAEQRSSGSEDFSYISQKVPSLMLALSAGSSEDGYSYPLHHPKVIFDESCLVHGVNALSLIALKLQ